jgi:hypothetical protein
MKLRVPAYCPNCGKLSFPTLPIEIADNANPIFTFSASGTICPNCGGRAQIFDGTYTKDLISTILKIGVNKSDLEKFSQIVETANRKSFSRDEVVEAIEKDAPKLSPLKVFLMHDIGLITVLGFLLTLAGFIYTITQNNPKPPTVEEIMKAFREAQTEPNSNANKKPFVKAKPSVNAPCICGSGKKYKKCCQSKGRWLRYLIKISNKTNKTRVVWVKTLITKNQKIPNPNTEIMRENFTKSLIHHRGFSLTS